MSEEPRTGLATARSLTELRERAGLSRAQLAATAGLTRRTVKTLERGVRVPTVTEADALAGALGVRRATIHRASWAPHEQSTGAPADLDSERLLVEYIAMVRELRAAQVVAPSTLRQHDLSELANALGGSPEAIELRLMDLLDTSREHAAEVRAAIVPSW